MSSINCLEGFIRAFWRRIEPYKNMYGKELPDELPLEFKSHAETAAILLRGGELAIHNVVRKIKSEIDSIESEHGFHEGDTNSFTINDSRAAYIEGLEFAIHTIESELTVNSASDE